MIGREREIAELRELLAEHRLVTLVGAPGVGKTRLGLQLAAGLLGAFPEGAWLVEFGPLTNPSLVPQAVADVLGVREQAGRTVTTILIGWLKSRKLLLLLDNCEHLIGAAAALADALLPACPRLHILATSREPLAIEGEVIRRVPSLSVPDAGQIASKGADGLGRIADTEAVRLFVERARAVDSSFVLTERNGAAVAQVCRRLDGIPLALELAAARVGALSVEHIAARLDDRFRLLVAGNRTALPRQQTLLGSVAWSYDLLSEPERMLLRRLAVFAGGFTVAAADFVGGQRPARGCASEDAGTVLLVSGDPLPADLLASLVGKSLVQIDNSGDDERRYRLLETIRQYGEEKLAEHGELTDARARHRDYFLQFAEQAAPELFGPAQAETLSMVEREHDNLRAALAWCQEEAGAEPHEGTPGAVAWLRMAGALFRFWHLRGHISEGHHWLTRALAAPVVDTSSAAKAARATALIGLADLTAYRGNYRGAQRVAEEARVLWEESGDERRLIHTMRRLGFFLAHVGEYNGAIRRCAESVALARKLQDTRSLTMSLVVSAIVYDILGRWEESVGFAEEHLALCRQIGAVSPLAYALRILGRAVGELGDLGRATALVEEAFGIFRQMGDRRGAGITYHDLGHLAVLAGEAARAVGMLQAGIPILHEIGDRWMVALCAYELAGARILQASQRGVAHASGGPPDTATTGLLLDGARLLAIFDARRLDEGIVLFPALRPTYDRHQSTLRELLGAALFAEAWSDGMAMSEEHAVSYALTLPRFPGPHSSDVPARAEPVVPERLDSEQARLTTRELEVAGLVARGWSNRQIADVLILSERTVESHVHNILGKLELRSRAQVVVWAMSRKLGPAGCP